MLKTLLSCVLLGLVVQPLFAQTTNNLASGEALSAAPSSPRKGFETCELEYKRGWRSYLKTIRRVGPKYQKQFDTAAMVLKAHEDKTFRGDVRRKEVSLYVA